MAMQSTPGRFEQLTTATPGQQQLQSNILSQALQALLSSGQQPGFQPIAQQARRQFAQQTVPSLAERFTSMGGTATGALSSPAFASQIGQAGSTLDTNLAALRSQYQQNQQGKQQDLLRLLLGFALQPQFQHIYKPGETGSIRSFFNNFIPAALNTAGQVGSAYLTGGASAIPQLASQLGNYSQPTQVQSVPSISQQMQNALYPSNQFGGY